MGYDINWGFVLITDVEVDHQYQAFISCHEYLLVTKGLLQLAVFLKATPVDNNVADQ